jgi:hypothetical protein
MTLLNIGIVLALAAFLVTIASAMGKAPVWIAVLLLCILALMKALPPMPGH